jgi:hypothetical protein
VGVRRRRSASHRHPAEATVVAAEAAAVEAAIAQPLSPRDPDPIRPLPGPTPLRPGAPLLPALSLVGRLGPLHLEAGVEAGKIKAEATERGQDLKVGARTARILGAAVEAVREKVREDDQGDQTVQNTNQSHPRRWRSKQILETMEESRGQTQDRQALKGEKRPKTKCPVLIKVEKMAPKIPKIRGREGEPGLPRALGRHHQLKIPKRRKDPRNDEAGRPRSRQEVPVPLAVAPILVEDHRQEVLLNRANYQPTMELMFHKISLLMSRINNTDSRGTKSTDSSIIQSLSRRHSLKCESDNFRPW